MFLYLVLTEIQKTTQENGQSQWLHCFQLKHKQNKTSSEKSNYLCSPEQTIHTHYSSPFQNGVYAVYRADWTFFKTHWQQQHMLSELKVCGDRTRSTADKVLVHVKSHTFISHSKSHWFNIWCLDHSPIHVNKLYFCHSPFVEKQKKKIHSS